MTKKTEPTRVVTVNILDKEYQVACPEEQEADLLNAAAYLDEQMRSIRETGKVVGLERVAVMAALNISHELLQRTAEPEAPTADEVDGLSRKIDEAMFSLRQMEIG